MCLRNNTESKIQKLVKISEISENLWKSVKTSKAKNLELMETSEIPVLLSSSPYWRQKIQTSTVVSGHSP